MRVFQVSAIIFLFTAAMFPQSPARLPANWTMRQIVGADSWTWTMQQTGANTWNGHSRKDSNGEQGDWTFTLVKTEGNKIYLQRAGVGMYTGTLSGDGRSLSGTCDFVGGTWNAAFDRSVLIPQSTPTVSTTLLPANWTMRQIVAPDSWTWTMSQTGTNTWNGHSRKDSTGEQGDWTFTLVKTEGNRIYLQRAGVGMYTGTLSGDGRSLSGTCDFVGGTWNASFDQSGVIVQPAPTRDLGATLVVIYPGVCTAIWTRTRPGVYDSVTVCQGPGNASFRETLAVLRYESQTVIINRPNYGQYRGTLSADRRTIRGTCDWAGCTPNYRWTAYIDWNWNDAPPLR